MTDREFWIMVYGWGLGLLFGSIYTTVDILIGWHFLPLFVFVGVISLGTVLGGMLLFKEKN